MTDTYQIPAVILTTLLLPAFGNLYLRTRDTRNLLWLLALFFTVLRMILVYPMSWWGFSAAVHPWAVGVGESCAMLASGLFLGSLSPLRFRIGKFRGLYVVPYTIPLLVYALFSNGLYPDSMPRGLMVWFFPALGLISIGVGLRWDQAKGTLPTWIGSIACVVFGGMALWIYFHAGAYWALNLAESGNHVITALLVISVFRRVSTGVVVSVAGFLFWSMPVLFLFHQIGANPTVGILLLRLIVMAKVVAGLGLILLALENEMRANKASEQRERRVRKELEAYANLVLSRRRLADFDYQAEEVCRTVVEHSRFSHAALLLLQPHGAYELAAGAGIDSATARALGALAARLPSSGFLESGSAPSAVENSQTVQLNLEPWMEPGDDLVGLNFTSVLAVPMRGGSTAEGALILAGLRKSRPDEPIRAEDLVPVEMLTARLQSVRSQTRMLEKLVDSEKFAGLGQLASNVGQQLNNPLTVILGYASLLEETPHLDAQERKSVESILNSARAMRSTLESLQRVARAPNGHLAAVSVSEMLIDMEHLYRSEFLQRSIDLRLNIAPGLPRVLCQASPLRQAILHCLQFAMSAVEDVRLHSDRVIRLEARSENGKVQIVVAHSGPGFEHPERAFDPFVPSRSGAGETAGLGLSLCATILRDCSGQVSAVNLDPTGAAILLQLQAA